MRQDEYVHKYCESRSCISMGAGYMYCASCIMSYEIFLYIFIYVKHLAFFVMVVETVCIQMDVNYKVLEEIPCKPL